VSAPVPPIIRSSPALPVMVSLPPSPAILSALARPTSAFAAASPQTVVRARISSKVQMTPSEKLMRSRPVPVNCPTTISVSAPTVMRRSFVPVVRERLTSLDMAFVKMSASVSVAIVPPSTICKCRFRRRRRGSQRLFHRSEHHRPHCR
jgi:hypothetical protein